MFQMKKLARGVASLAVVLGLTGAAVAQDGGAVVVDGSSTVYPIGEHIAAEFRKADPSIRVTIAVSGTGGGFKRFATGETDISHASRPIKKEEADAAAANGVEFIEIPVAYDGLSVVVNKSNTFIDKLTVEQLMKIYLEGGAKTWKEVNPSWPDIQLRIYSPGTDSGTFDYMKEVLTSKDKNAKFRADMQVSEDDNVLVTGVAGDQGGVGYFGSAYYFENKDKLRAVPIVNKKGEAIEPTPETIMDGTYNPLSRPLFIYVNKASLNKPAVRKFVEFYLDNAGDAASAVGYVALPDELYDRGEVNLKNQKVGTQYLNEQGKHKEGALSDIYK